MIERAGNIFLVSHSLGTVKDICERSIWIYQREVIVDGPTEIIAKKCHEWARLRGKQDNNPAEAFLRTVQSEYRRPEVTFVNRF